MKQVLVSIGLVAGVFIAVWLYHRQLGAIPFILLSFVLFYLTVIELNKKKEAAVPAQEVIQKKDNEKKAEIIT